MDQEQERSQRNPFAALPLDRLGEQREAFVLEAHLQQALWLRTLPDGRLLLQHGAQGLRLSLTRKSTADERPWCLLGRFQQQHYLLEQLAHEDEVDAGEGEWLDLRASAEALPHFEAGLAAYARALTLWRHNHRHCGRCGAPTQARAAGHRLSCSRPQCGGEHFPRIDPAMIVAVSAGSQLLLARQASWPARRYSVLAGFVEPGETLEDCVRREVHEEAGLKLTQVHYHSSQPWPFPSALMVGFTAEASDTRLVLGRELEHAAWFDPGTLRAAVQSGELRLPTAISISRRLIEDWYAQHSGESLSALESAQV